jgi:hypothetical protein
LKYTKAGFAIHSEPAGEGRKKKRKQKNPGINPGQPIRKGREKKTLVLTLGSPPKKGEK